tara:strand:+ start:257 stop:583 length:327 start_codon:yes stop_codon:yes gene_type:complete
MRFEFTEEEVATLIDALGVWMEQPSEWEGEEWLRRQDIGADLDLDLREGLATGEGNVVDDAADTFIQAGIDAREQAKATSRAATRREEQFARMMKGTTDTLANDPVDW